MISHRLSDLFAPAPPAYLLSNGRFRSLISAAGSGYCGFRNIALTRWHGDRIEDNQGYFIYLRDIESGAFNSVGYQPVNRAAENYRACYSAGCFSIERDDEAIHIRMDIAVSPDDDIEVRRLQLENRSDRSRRIELTSYLEVVLNEPMRDTVHPAFSKLFVQTERDADSGTLIARRRPSSDQESWPWLFHRMVGVEATSRETDRLRFIGRGRTLQFPAAMESPEGFSGTVGNVLDPVFSLRTRIELAAGESASLAFVTGVAADRPAALELSRRYDSLAKVENILRRAAESEEALNNSIAVNEETADRFQQLAGAMLYGDPRLSAGSCHFAAAASLQSTLDRFGISNDRPLVLIRNEWESAVVGEVLRAFRYWCMKGLECTLVVVARGTQQRGDLDMSVDNVIALDVEKLAIEEIEQLCAAAGLVVTDGLPVLWPAKPTESERVWFPDDTRAAPRLSASESDDPVQAEDLLFFNGIGGFSSDATEYVIRLQWRNNELQRPPMPWINVVANEHCGFLVSDSGAVCTWSRNSQANRLTMWSNDPVMDPHSEAFYIRDEESGQFWSPFPGPRPAPCAYEIRHGFGYSVSRCRFDGLDHSATLFVPRDDPLRIVRFKLVNSGETSRRLSLFSYCRLILGTVPSPPGSIVTDRGTDAILVAVNHGATDFADGIVFCFSVLTGGALEARHFTCDRQSFIGRNGSTGNPRALRGGAPLDGAYGAGLDPCFAEQLVFTLVPGEAAECAFFLGECTSMRDLEGLARHYRQVDAVDRALAEVKNHWQAITGRVQIKTPTPAIDVLLNGWLIYQNLGCRMLARSAFYQSSGAYGYRDQLQDSAALLFTRPDLTRRQILLHAGRQFAEGDVFHWWHPEPMGTGIRTRMSDDRLWLVYVVCRYIEVTGDYGILDESAPFVTGPAVAEGMDDAFFRPSRSPDTADLYQHCCLGLDCSLTTGVHGLPLIGTGDWNDGMNRVGRRGAGESVWLGFFLYDLLEAFQPLCERRGDRDRAARYTQYRSALSKALDSAGWDGEWYRRAFFDDGSALGTREDTECRIDALPQAWAVISKAVPQCRAEKAMASVERLLVSEAEGLIRLLTPPFVDTPRDPGYIKGYVSGIRENGGQYTHAACWVVMAFALLGKRDLAVRLAEMLSPV
ncbi:MAG: GH36-type glycosyl hydrolase domain-containing protein, partial [Gammaproteobacteria bacterium]